MAATAGVADASKLAVEAVGASAPVAGAVVVAAPAAGLVARSAPLVEAVGVVAPAAGAPAPLAPLFGPHFVLRSASHLIYMGVLVATLLQVYVAAPVCVATRLFSSACRVTCTSTVQRRCVLRSLLRGMPPALTSPLSVLLSLGSVGCWLSSQSHPPVPAPHRVASQHGACVPSRPPPHPHAAMYVVTGILSFYCTLLRSATWRSPSVRPLVSPSTPLAHTRRRRRSPRWRVRRR